MKPRTTPDDKIIGANLRRIRRAAKVTMEALGGDVGITFQQVQKYESGVNRLSLSRALEICRVMQISINDLTRGC